MVGRKFGATATGALSGAGIGSSLGPIGAGIGALVGGLGGYFGSRGQGRGALDNPEYEKQISHYTPEQQDIISKINSILRGEKVGGPLGDIFSEEGYQKFAAPYKKDFEENIIPGLAERFSGAFGTGAASAQRSSAFQNQLAKAGSDFETNLAYLRSNQQQNYLNNLLNASLGNQFTTYYEPPSPSGYATAGATLGKQVLGSFTPENIRSILEIINSFKNKKIGQGSYSSIEPGDYRKTYYTR